MSETASFASGIPVLNLIETGAESNIPGYRREIKFDQKGKLFRLIREQQKIKFDPISGGRLTTGHFSLK
jgi:hypothetical protein